MPRVEAVALPDHLTVDQLRGKIAIVIDVLRATTTIVEALSHGARSVVAVASVDAARMISHDRPGSLLCGERGGIKPDGFALGNSPFEYTREHIVGVDCVLTTTNGTRALHMSQAAETILIGSVTNLDSLCLYVRSLDQDVVLVCSGTDRMVSLEDCLCAGLIVDRLGFDADDSAQLLLHAMRGAIKEYGGLEGAIRSSYHAQRLIDLGFENDVLYSSRDSISDIVPVFDPALGEIQGV